MGMRVRGKSTARPDKVGGPTLDAGASGRIPDSVLEHALAVPNVEDFSSLVFPAARGPQPPPPPRRCREMPFDSAQRAAICSARPHVARDLYHSAGPGSRAAL
jgi:hypothetical protein